MVPLAAWVSHEESEEAPTWAEVLRLYAAFRPHGTHGWRTVEHVCALHNVAARKVDVRRLVYAGVLNGILRRVDPTQS